MCKIQHHSFRGLAAHPRCPPEYQASSQSYWVSKFLWRCCRILILEVCSWTSFPNAGTLHGHIHGNLNKFFKWSSSNGLVSFQYCPTPLKECTGVGTLLLIKIVFQSTTAGGDCFEQHTLTSSDIIDSGKVFQSLIVLGVNANLKQFLFVDIESSRVKD